MSTTTTRTQQRIYHLYVEFSVTLNDIPDDQIVAAVGEYAHPRNETWEYHIQQVARALWANPTILDSYLAHSTAWHLMLDLGGEAEELCQALGVPEESAELFPLLLGLHLPPTTRAFLKEMHVMKAQRDDTPYFFTEALGKVIALDWTGAGHHLAHE